MRGGDGCRGGDAVTPLELAHQALADDKLRVAGWKPCDACLAFHTTKPDREPLLAAEVVRLTEIEQRYAGYDEEFRGAGERTGALVHALEEQLTAVKAALREACRVAQRIVRLKAKIGGPPDPDIRRLDELAKVGEP